MSDLKRIDGKNLSPIPDDQEWGVGFFCFPDTPYWRGVIRGQFARLGQGWTYKNCRYGEVAIIGRQIEDTLEMDCKDIFQDMRDCLCVIAGLQQGPQSGKRGVETVDENACERARQVVSYPYFWALQMSRVKSGILSITAPITSPSSVLAIIDEIVVDSWVKKTAVGAIDALSNLFDRTVTTYFGIDIPQFALRDDTDYKGLLQYMEQNQAELIQAVYEACDAEQAKQAWDEVLASSGLTGWKLDYLREFVSLGYLEAVFDGSSSKLSELSGVGDWIDYECQGVRGCGGCGLVNGPELGDGFTNWDGMSWTSGVAGVTAQQEAGDAGSNLPFQIKLAVLPVATVSLSNLTGVGAVEVVTYNDSCDVVSTALWDGNGTYTSPAGSKWLIKDEQFPFYSWMVDIEVNV